MTARVMCMYVKVVLAQCVYMLGLATVAMWYHIRL